MLLKILLQRTSAKLLLPAYNVRCAHSVISHAYSISYENGNLAINQPHPALAISFNSVRLKSKKSKQIKPVEELSGDSDEEEEVVSGKGSEIKSSVVSSMRADLLLKVGLGLARNKVEEAFYESRMRINGKKILKKSTHVQVGDEVDIVKGPSPTNPKFIVVGRIDVLSAKPRDDGENINVKIRRSKQLVIDNYPDGDSWKQSETSGT